MQKISQCKDFFYVRPHFPPKLRFLIIPFSQQSLVTSAQCRTIIIISLYILAVNELVLKKNQKLLQDCAEINVFPSEQAA